MRIRTTFAGGLAGLLLAIGTPGAEDRALVIAIADYQYECPATAAANQCHDPDLPGIDRDLGRVQEVLELLGFAEHQVQVLRDREASLTGVRMAIEQWLIRGVTAEDRVILYFSGHGSQIPDAGGDEADGFDEVLLTWDMAIVDGSLENVLVDDELGALLKRVPAQRSLVLFDACHSGTASKAWFATGSSA